MIRKWIYKLRYILIIGSALLGLLGASGTFGANLEVVSDLPYSYTYNNSNFTVDEKLNFGDITEGVGKIQLPGSSYDWRYFYWREDGQIYTIGILQNNRIRAQGFISGFAIFNAEPTYIQIANTPNNIPIEDFYNGDYGTNFSQIKIKCNVNAYECGMCFKNEQNQYICFYSIDNRNLKNSKGYTYTNEQMILDNVVGEDSPFVGGGGGGLITGSGSITNYEALMGYGYTYGFSENFCYGGYSLDNIFYPTENPQDFTGFEMGSGAYIYDIYEAYSGSYFSSASQFYQSFYSRYLVNNIASFYNYPKALYGIVERYAMLYNDYQTYDPNIGISKLVSYCELRKLDPSAEYTGGDISAIDGFNSLMGEITDKWWYYESGPLSLLSGEDQKLDSDKFFTFLSDSVINGFGDLSNKSSGIIPNYIIAVLLALVLFRMFSH